MRGDGRRWSAAAGLLALACAGAADGAGGIPVAFVSPPGVETETLSPARRREIAGWIRDTAGRIADLTGVKPRPVRIVVFRSVSAFVLATGMPPWIGGVTTERAILLQPTGVLERSGALERIVRHEAVHHALLPAGADWPDALHEALGHRYSGGPARRSSRAGPLSAARRTAAEELEWLDHLAWELECAMQAAGEAGFLRDLLAGEADVSVFRSADAELPGREGVRP